MRRAAIARTIVAGEMLCRHTVPDWHRYVASEGEGRPIFAACRLLVKEGAPASDPRSIACGYWGRQRSCPLYDGPEAVSSAPRTASVGGDTPVGSEQIWPVQGPAAAGRPRRGVLVLGGASAGILIGVLIVGIGAFSGDAMPTARMVAIACGIGAGSIGLTISVFRLWVRGW